MDKKSIRAKIKILTKENKEKLPEMGKSICNKIINSDLYHKSKIILAYAALPDEVDLFPVIENALTAGKKVYLPKIYPNTNLMDFFPYTNSIKIEKGSFGILEPDSNQKKYVISAETLVLVPGRAFTSDGKRLGRGKGFYDIYFQNTNEMVILAGVCFPFQIIKDIPCTAQDVKMNYIFSTYLPVSE